MKKNPVSEIKIKPNKIKSFQSFFPAILQEHNRILYNVLFINYLSHPFI